MGKLTHIITGRMDRPTHQGEFTTAMKSISLSLQAHESELKKYWKPQRINFDARVFASCSRMLLEQGAAVILGRLDPIRLVTIVKGSSSGDFKLGQRNASSFVWNKDVLLDVKPQGGSYWTQESLNKGIHRALLEGHLADYIFSTAHDTALDLVTEETSSLIEVPDWIIEILKIEKGEAVLARLRTAAAEAYSTLSKGIHFEFFLGRNTQPSVAEIKKATSQAVLVIATASLYTHLSDIGVYKIDPRTATKSFISIVSEYQHNG